MSVTSPKNPIGFAERLTALRTQAGFRSQAALAAAAGLTTMTVNRAESPNGSTGKKALQAIVSTLRQRIDFDEAWLVYDEGTPYPPESVLHYLEASGLAVGIAPEVQGALRRFPWEKLCVANPSTEQIALIRMMLETNLRLR